MKLTIAMVTGGLPFSGNTLTKRGLGGSETAFIYLANAFAKLGHTVHAFCNCDDPGFHDGVAYYSYKQFQIQSNQIPYDVVIVSRWPEFLRLENQSACKIFWLHDTLEDPKRFMGHLYPTDWIYLLSEYHLENYTKQIPEISSFAKLTTNGIDMDAVRMAKEWGVIKDRNTLLFSSRPERGLLPLLTDIFPRLLEKNPDYVLKYCSYELQGLETPKEIQELHKRCDELAEQFGDSCVKLGSLSKISLYGEMLKAGAWVYPTNFPEISCISALEAQACGLPVVTTDNFALSETVCDSPNNFLIDGKPDSKEYIEKFVNAVVAATNIQTDCPVVEKHISKYEWLFVAKKWESDIEEFFSTRLRNNKDAVHEEMLRHGCIAGLGKPVGTMEKNSFPENSQECIAIMKQAMPRFNFCLQFLESLEVSPSTLIDYHPGYASFGLLYAKKHVDVDVLTIEPSFAASQLQANANAAKLENYKILTKLEQIDGSILFVGSELAYQQSPGDFLNRITKDLGDNTFILLTCPIGPVAEKYDPILKTNPSRLWNLNHKQLLRMFEDCAEFKWMYVEEGKNRFGESHGYCIAYVSLVDHLGGRVKFKNPSPNEIQLLTRPYQSISACVIARNNSDTIKMLLSSIVDVVDEIIVVNTQESTDTDLDNTPEICEEYGASVISVKFDNFSQVRNISRDAASGKWILWIDTDERLIEGFQLRKHLSGNVFEGFALKQMHLTTDELDKTFDVPVRLFRNRPQYRSAGLIHEHFYDVSQNPFDDSIKPVVLLSDTLIAHYGYVTESIRQKKCSNRNMTLLHRAIKEEPNRKLTWVLVIRDYLNILKWKAAELEMTQKFAEASELLEAVVDTFHQHFPTKSSTYYSITFPMYQEALMLMGKLGLPYKDNPVPPFQVLFSLAGSVGGFKGDYPQPDSIWFLDYEEFSKFMKAQQEQLAMSLGVLEGVTQHVDLTAKIYGIDDNATALLAQGINVK